MQKIRLGGHVFREKQTAAPVDTCEKYCIVIAKNPDDTAKLIVFETDGSQFVIDRAELVQLCDEVQPHYEEYFSASEKPVAEGVHLCSEGQEVGESSPLQQQGQAAGSSC